MSTLTPNITNPYFDPDPVWLFIIMKIEFAISCLSTTLGYYLIIYKSPSYNTKTFKRFLLYHITVGLLFEATYCVFSISHIYLPYSCSRFLGFFSFVGLPIDLQAAIYIQLIVSISTALCPLFYYRMDVIIPHNHPLKKKWLKYLVYICVYIISYVIPIPIIMFTINYRDQSMTKRLLFEKFHVFIQDFWTSDVLCYYSYDNPWTIVVASICIPAIICATAVIFGSTVIIYRTLKTRGTLSIQTKQHHRIMLRSLISLMLVLCSALLVFIPFLIYSFLVGHNRAEAIAGSGFPLAIWAYVLTYNPYRRALIQLFCKERKQQSSPNSFIDWARQKNRRIYGRSEFR